MKTSLRSLVLTAMIAALYAVTALALQPLSFGPLQFRASEALTLLPILLPEGVVGVSLGCFLANLTSPFGAWDWVLGTFATLLAALGSRYFRKHFWLAAAMPVLFNGLIVAAYLAYLNDLPYWSTALYIAVSETGVVLLLGMPLITAIRRYLEKRRH
ncbi:MAG: QueT transporter family protein [Negativicutes bacterium]|nr:QueT transporter family protein [Negativicutes bacterium]